MSWSGPTSRIVLAIEPKFLAGVVDETAHLLNVELRPTLTFEDQHIIGVMRALRADLEDGVTGWSALWPIIGCGTLSLLDSPIRGSECA